MGQNNEPSMEEILSSIKRIISEDTDASPVPARRARPSRAAEPDVLELTQAIEPETMMGSAWVEPPETTSAPEPVEEPVIMEPQPIAPPEPLLSVATADASRQALATLSRMVVKSEDPAADNSLEALVRELLRPMLKDWLDANLPGIVQATVDREVARISGR